MRTEISKSFDQGFLLSEQELRRIHDTVVQHVARKLQPDNVHRSYEIKYANGGISHPSSIDEALGEENIGSKAIVRLQLAIGNTAPEHGTSIHISFHNPIHESNKPPIRYEVTGNERDWVFVATSDLNERLNRILTLGIVKNWSKNMVLMVSLLMLSMFVYFVFTMDRSMEAQGDAVDQVQQAWLKGELKDPIDAMLRLEKARDARGKNVSLVPMIIAIIAIALQVLSSPIKKAFYFLFPPYTFYWGETVTEYDRRQRMTRVLMGTVIGGIVLSVLANLLTEVLFGR